MTSIESYAFSGCSALTQITIPEGVTSIGQFAFKRCDALTQITIPNSVTSIGYYAFAQTGLTAVAIPDSVTSLGEHAFYECDALASVTLSEGLTGIEASTFEKCKHLASVTIPANVKSIGKSAFRYCSALESVTLPAGLKSIGETAFGSCKSLTDIYYLGTDWSGITKAKYWNTGNPSGQIVHSVPAIAVTVSPAKSGTATVSYHQDGSVTVTALAGIGYSFSSWTQDGQVISDSAAYSFMPDSVYSLTASFEVCLAGSGTEGDPWLILSAAHWDKLAADLADGLDTAGKYVSLTEDISVSAMIGTASRPFRGVFDGAGHTLTFTCENHPEIAAPFRYIRGATIRNLHVTGSITGPTLRASGLIGENSGTSAVVNCHVSAAISGNRLIGGLCIGTGDTLTITGSVFDGKITGDPDQSGCFVAWGTGGLNIADSIAAPQSGTVFTGGTFCHTGGGTPTLTNCYYMESSGNAQGKQAFSVTADEGVTVNFGTPTATYSLSGITAYATGLVYGGHFYAGQGETVTLGVSAESWDGHTTSFTANAGTLTVSNNAGTLTMPGEDVVISVLRTPTFATSPAVRLAYDGGSTGWYGSQGPDKLFDGLDNTKWCTPFDGTNWVEFHTDTPVFATAYAMTTAADAASYLRRNPISWRLLGKRNAGDSWTILTEETNSDHLPAENSVEIFFPLTASGGYQYFRLEITAVNSGNQMQIAKFKLVGIPTFGMPTFTMPTMLTTIEESAFEGMTAMTIVDAHTCAAIDAYAFKGCTGLTQIRLPADCAIDTTAFEGCGTVYIFAPAGGTTAAYCQSSDNPCVFVEETQN